MVRSGLACPGPFDFYWVEDCCSSVFVLYFYLFSRREVQERETFY